MKITIKGHLVGWHFESMRDPNAVSWGFVDYTPSQLPSMVALVPHEFTVEAPEVNVIAAQVASLEVAKLKALEGYQKTVGEINDRLAKLQAITCEVAP